VIGLNRRFGQGEQFENQLIHIFLSYFSVRFYQQENAGQECDF